MNVGKPKPDVSMDIHNTLNTQPNLACDIHDLVPVFAMRTACALSRVWVAAGHHMPRPSFCALACTAGRTHADLAAVSQTSSSACRQGHAGWRRAAGFCPPARRLPAAAPCGAPAAAKAAKPLQWAAPLGKHRGALRQRGAMQSPWLGQADR